MGQWRPNNWCLKSIEGALGCGLLTLVLSSASLTGFSQTVAKAAEVKPAPDVPATAKPNPNRDPDDAPLTAAERRELLETIRELRKRMVTVETELSSLKAERAKPAESDTAETKNTTSVPVPIPGPPVPVRTEPQPGDASVQSASQDEDKKYGRYTPNLGIKIADTELGDMSISIYTYARYLNQRGLAGTYVDAFGNVKSVQERQDVQLTKLQFKFLGWVLSPKLRYFLYAWTSNANQGQGAQVVLAGNLHYQFNQYLRIGGGIRSLPGTRSVEGNFPFWTNVDSRHIADEFFRPSYTSGIWATGDIVKDRLRYTVMLGNNMSTLGVPASRLDNGLNTLSSALVWFPTGDFELNFSDEGWGDFFHHKEFATRVGFHYTRSDENKESQPNSEQFENTQLRLSDGTVIFTSNLFGPGITVTDARYQMISLDGAFKYKGFSLEGEYYFRWLDRFRGQNTQTIPNFFDHGFQIQGTAMLTPRSVQVYTGFSKIFGNHGNPWDYRAGLNFFPFKNKVVRWNTEALYLFKSPVGYTSVAYPVGGRGWVFSSTVELAF